MHKLPLSGSESLTLVLQKLAHALANDPNVSPDTAEAAQWLLECLDQMYDDDTLIAVQR